MKLPSIKIVLTIVILIAIYWLIKILFIDTSLDLENPLNPSIITTENFEIEPSNDTTLIGQKGTILIINKNTFIDCNNQKVSGKVTIQLKEVISKSDMILSGLITLSNGKILETGGMIYLNAYNKGRQLCINDSSVIGIIMKNNSGNSDMKLFKGTLTNNSLNWTNPIPIINNPDTIVKNEGRYLKDSLTLIEAIESGLVEFDTTVYPKRLIRSKDYDSLIVLYNLENDIRNGLCSIFETKNLGWLNIDRFLEQYRTDKINLNVFIKNGNAFNTVFVRLVFLDLQILLTGYELNDKRYTFGKTGSTEVNLPLGERVIIVATAYNNRKPYIGLKEFIIQENQVINLEIKESTMDKIQGLIDNKF